MKFPMFLFLFVADSVFATTPNRVALGDPNFIPANPPDSRMAPPIDSMIDTTETANQTVKRPGEEIGPEDKKKKQSQEEQKDAELLDHRYDEPERK